MNGITIIRSVKFLIAIKKMQLVIRTAKEDVYANLVIGGIPKQLSVRNKLF